jgi:hypothetical protein
VRLCLLSKALPKPLSISIEEKAINIASEPIIPYSLALIIFIRISILTKFRSCCPNLSIKLQKRDRIVLLLSEDSVMRGYILQITHAKVVNFSRTGMLKVIGNSIKCILYSVKSNISLYF